jgi:hypothetical protein
VAGLAGLGAADEDDLLHDAPAIRALAMEGLAVAGLVVVVVGRGGPSETRGWPWWTTCWIKEASAALGQEVAAALGQEAAAALGQEAAVALVEEAAGALVEEAAASLGQEEEAAAVLTEMRGGGFENELDGGDGGGGD